MLVARLHRYVNGEHVGIAIEVGFLDGLAGKIQQTAHVEQVVVNDFHAKPQSRDMAHAATNPAHPQNAKSQLVELHATLGANSFPFLRRIDSVAKQSPWPQQAEHVAEHEIRHRLSVGVGCIDNLNASLAAGGDVDVFQSNATTPHNPQSRRLGEQRRIDARVGADHKPLGQAKRRLELRIVVLHFDDLCALAQPVQRRRIGTFCDNNKRPRHSSHHRRGGAMRKSGRVENRASYRAGWLAGWVAGGLRFECTKSMPTVSPSVFSSSG